ncbi:hypothetical protein LC653_30035 [Nostoc sp. CHAB 5784]|uniref:hypothetical protein n=1 Tax=Nostoc mirabile TaxID=2907820 RepID=UPI001E581CDC|nr:hypothetical protein [Nostoc mirabile]MCC5668000.1 hypothetical protein [Nostoc mirabile CHAB5784]
MSELSKPKSSMERLERMIRASWLVEIQKELIKRDENPLLVNLDNCHLFERLTPQQAADAAINLQKAK